MSSFIHGVKTVAAQEFRIRIRAGRWKWLLGAWFVVLLGFSALLFLAVNTSDAESAGTQMFGWLMLFVLGLALVVVPSLTATSINGDRERGTLATLQVTLLSPVEIALGKLVAAWGTALVFLGLSLPMVAWSMLEGGAAPDRALISLVVVALMLGVICAICQALSAVFARSTTSAVFSYIVMFMLTIGTLISFALASALMTETRTEQPQRGAFSSPGYTPQPYTYEVNRTDLVWWIVAPNPFVILADGAPALPKVKDPYTGRYVSQDFDVLGGIGSAVRETRLDPDEERNYDYSGGGKNLPAVWPWGLAMGLALGAGAFAITVRRLQTPQRKLSRGVRIA